MASPRPRPQVIRLTEAAAERIKYVMANAVKPAVLPGEELRVRVIQEGKEAGQGVGLNNISNVLARQKDYAGSLTYLEQAMQIARETGNRRSIANRLNNAQRDLVAANARANALAKENEVRAAKAGFTSEQVSSQLATALLDLAESYGAPQTQVLTTRRSYFRTLTRWSYAPIIAAVVIVIFAFGLAGLFLPGVRRRLRRNFTVNPTESHS